jgi:hypothetical protein
VNFEAPDAVPRFDVAEFVVRVTDPPFQNPFTEAELTGVFASGEDSIRVEGFSDSQDGSVFRLRFCPSVADVTFDYDLRLTGGGIDCLFSGQLRCDPSDREGPVIVDPERPHHFIHAASRQHFYHLGYTAYHLLDSSNDDAQVEATIDHCAQLGFNKIRFLLTGYPRDTDERPSSGEVYAVPDNPWRAPNYGAGPGQVNPLPAWLGDPHHYDFTRFNIAHWQRVDRAVQRMRERGIVAACIFTIEKQNLPQEYGRLTEHELRLYRYAVARLAAHDNVWWDLGNEFTEYRDVEWGNIMGALVEEADPHDRLASTHAHEEFLFTDSQWADFIITQQYGDEQEVHDWALRHRSIPMPYVNEEYGYEGSQDRPGHLQSADWVRRCHWAIAMAGGYATYGDWSNGVSHFYMGRPGPGQAARQLLHLRRFFEALPFEELEPQDSLVRGGFYLAQPPEHFVLYLPHGGTCEIALRGAPAQGLVARWFDPRTGAWQDGPSLSPGPNTVTAPTEADWALHIRAEEANQ